MNKLLALLGLAVLLSLAPGSSRAQSGDLTIVPLYNGWNVASVTSGSAVFGADAKPTRAASALRICVVLGSTTPISIRETDGTHTFTSLLNGGTALTAGCYYTFVVELRHDNSSSPSGPSSFNFVVQGPTTVPILRATEVAGGVD